MSKLAVVTGGAQGIGRAIVDALLTGDVVDRVAVLDLQPERLDQPGPSVTAHACDVTDEASVRAAYAAAIDGGDPPVVLVNNAGGGRPGSVEEGFAAPGTDDPGQAATAFDPFAPVEDFRDMVELNFTSAHVVTRVIGPDLAAGAAICNTASIAGLTANRLYAYGAAKAALIHWTRSMAQALAPRHIRVNAVAPGIIRTNLWERMQPDEAAYNAMIDEIMPMGEDQKPSDIADAVAFLCSDRARQITGEVIRIDGGLTLR